MLNDVAGQALYGWDSRDHRLRTSYDALRRPTEVHRADRRRARSCWSAGRCTARASRTRSRTTCAASRTRPSTAPAWSPPRRTTSRATRSSSSRQLAVDYQTTPDWSTPVALEAEVFTTRTSYDALNRPVTQTTPDGSTHPPHLQRGRPARAIEANLRGEPRPGSRCGRPSSPTSTTTPRASASAIAYGNGVATTYGYDPLTFRLIRLQTLDAAASALQDLSYTYDPAGNITHIRDDAQQTIFFRNRRVEPSNDYTYDAIYRLIEATGREHLGQVDGARHRADRVRRFPITRPGASRRRQRDGPLPGAVRLRRGRQHPARCSTRQRPGAPGLDARLHTTPSRACSSRTRSATGSRRHTVGDGLDASPTPTTPTAT